jgi:SRSO17 transposase
LPFFIFHKTYTRFFFEEGTKTTKETFMAFFPKEVWTTARDQLSQQIRQHFVRPEPHQRALTYMQGLMSTASRKNGWQVAEEMGEATPYAIQHLLDRARWDCDGVRNESQFHIFSYASARGHTLLDREMYLPKSWTDDLERCREADVPTSVTFATKPELARRMVERTLDACLPVAWVTGDTVYGSSLSLRVALETRKQAYATSSTLQRVCGGARNSAAS